MPSEPESAPQAASPAPAGGRTLVHTSVDFNTLYSEYFRFVWRNLRRLGVDEMQLDDAAQDVFLVVHRRLHDYEPAHSPKAWLFAIARRVASDYRRTRRRKGGLMPLPAQLEADGCQGPADGARRNAIARLLCEFLVQLEEPGRDAFILSELEQMTAPEIAAALSITSSAVYSRVRAARRAFQEYVLAKHPRMLEDLDG